jgi:hypothetical protein
MIALSMAMVGGGAYADEQSKESAGAEEASMEEYLEMQAQSEAFRAVADSFIAVAAAGDAEQVASMISPNLAAQAGPEVVANVVANQVLPFFGQYDATVPNVTITQTTDQFGSSGYAYYMWMQPKETEGEAAEPRPFVLYVVQEGERIVIGNILVDYFVEGRH